MMMDMYFMNNLLEEIKQMNGKRLMLQIPDGLKTQAIKIIKDLEKAGYEVVLSNRTCYGACDPVDEEAKRMKCDIVVHLGHTKFYKDFTTAVPILYHAIEIDVDISDVDFSQIKEQKIGLLTTAQHTKMLSSVSSLLKGKDVTIGGQILGCWFENAKKIADNVDAFLFVGSGSFHPSGVIEKNKPVYVLDLEKKTVRKIDIMPLEKKRIARIANAKDALSFAILISTKKGQFELQGSVDEIKKMVEQKGKKAFIIIMDEIKEENLLGIDADAYINTACPRISGDSFSKPIVNVSDLDELFGD